MSEVKIEHFENDIQICNFVFTSPSGNQQIAWEGDADYLAVKQLQATIAEQGAEIENYKIQIRDIKASLRPIKNNVDLILKETTHD